MNGHCATSSAFILHGDGLSPLRSFDDYTQIPLYEFPYTYNDDPSYNDVNWWHNNYSDFSRLWFRGQIEESYFNELLSSLKSPLSLTGLEICKNIERLTGKDCYYYLFNYNNDIEGDNCPSCGGPWKLPEKMFEEFDLRCDKCKIISNTRIDE